MLRLDIFLIGILAMTTVGSAYALSSDVTLSPPSTVDARRTWNIQYPDSST